MLCTVRTLGFSETARSRPGHDKARGGLNDFFASSIFAGSHVDDVAKRPAERAQTHEADLEADVRHASVGLAQHEHGALDAAPLKVSVRRLAESRPKRPDEMGLGNAGDPGQLRDVEWMGVGTVDRIARPKHPAIQLLHG